MSNRIHAAEVCEAGNNPSSTTAVKQIVLTPCNWYKCLYEEIKKRLRP